MEDNGQTGPVLFQRVIGHALVVCVALFFGGVYASRPWETSTFIAVCAAGVFMGWFVWDAVYMAAGRGGE